MTLALASTKPPILKHSHVEELQHECLLWSWYPFQTCIWVTNCFGVADLENPRFTVSGGVSNERFARQQTPECPQAERRLSSRPRKAKRSVGLRFHTLTRICVYVMHILMCFLHMYTNMGRCVCVLRCVMVTRCCELLPLYLFARAVRQSGKYPKVYTPTSSYDAQCGLSCGFGACLCVCVCNL